MEQEKRQPRYAAKRKCREMAINKEEEIRIRKEQAEPVYDSRFIKVFDLQYAPEKHYYDVSRRSAENYTPISFPAASGSGW